MDEKIPSYKYKFKQIFKKIGQAKALDLFYFVAVLKRLSSLHDKYVIVPADKASNNIVFVCKSYYFECLIKELGINSNTSSNTTYIPTSFDKDEILANHRSFMTSLNIPSGKESEDLPYLYWIPKLHKTPYKERYIAGSSTCSTKELSIHLTKILSAVKEGQQKYCVTVYSRSGINHMWILKNSKDLLDNLKSRSFSHVSSIKTFDFSTLYTTLPHDKLKTHLKFIKLSVIETMAQNLLC